MTDKTERKCESALMRTVDFLSTDPESLCANEGWDQLDSDLMDFGQQGDSPTNKIVIGVTKQAAGELAKPAVMIGKRLSGQHTGGVMRACGLFIDALNLIINDENPSVYRKIDATLPQVSEQTKQALKDIPKNFVRAWEKN